MQTWTVGKLLEWSAPFFKQKGIASARLDAEVLLAHVLGIPRLKLYTGYDRPLEQRELDAYRAFVKRRAAHEPVAYIVGKKGFHEIELFVDRRVLIPRPETEQIVELARKALPEGSTFADIGTGSGCIALALLKVRPDLRAIAVDASDDALAVARKNAEALGLGDRIELRPGDLLAGVGPVAAVLSNPPYVETTAVLEPDVKEWEPALALFAGGDGLDVLRRLFEQGQKQPEGTLFFFEHGRGQAAALCAIADSLGYRDTRSERDLDGNERILCTRR